MELATLNIPVGLAREKFAEYHKAVKERHNTEDEAIMRGYREIIRGRQVIDIVATIKAGGYRDDVKHPWDKHRSDLIAPRLAVVRADALWCWLGIDAAGRVMFHGRKDNFNNRPNTNAKRYVVRLPRGTAAEDIPYNQRPDHNVRAMVPPVPPSLRPKDSLGNYHILWEAEWEAVAPIDPVLLKHIGGDLYAVLAMWDLTELERTVLARSRFQG